MLFNLLSAQASDSSSGIDASTLAATILAFAVVGAVIVAGIVFIIMKIVKGGFATVSQEEYERLYCGNCPFTGESLTLKVLQDKSHRTEVKETKQYRVSNVSVGGFTVDAEPIITKTGGDWVIGDSLKRYTSKSLGYSVLKEVKIWTEFDEHSGEDGDTYEYTRTTYTVEDFGNLTKSQQHKLVANCKKNTTTHKRRI